MPIIRKMWTSNLDRYIVGCVAAHVQHINLVILQNHLEGFGPFYFAQCFPSLDIISLQIKYLHDLNLECSRKSFNLLRRYQIFHN